MPKTNSGSAQKKSQRPVSTLGFRVLRVKLAIAELELAVKSEPFGPFEKELLEHAQRLTARLHQMEEALQQESNQ